MKTKFVKNVNAPEVPVRIVEGAMFIIPNHPATQNEIGWYNPSQWEQWKDNIKPSLNNLGLDIEETMIGIWTTNEAVDNFHCHFDTFSDKYLDVKSARENLEKVDFWEYRKNNVFPEYFPVSLLKDLEEGDTLVLTTNGGIQFRLKISQIGYRYERFGRFEQVLKSICNVVNWETIEA